LYFVHYSFWNATLVCTHPSDFTCEFTSNYNLLRYCSRRRFCDFCRF